MLKRSDVINRYRVADRDVPRLRVNFITSLDGAATEDGLSGGLNNIDDLVVFETLRMLSDVIVVGAGTIRAEGYGDIRLDSDAVAWRVGQGLPEQPTLVVVSSKLDLAPSHPVFTEAATRPLIVTHQAAPAERRVALAAVADVLVCGHAEVDVRLMLAELARRGMTQVLCEGGPHLFGTLIEEDCVDELCLTVAPVLEGGSAGRIASGGSQTPRGMTLLQMFAAGNMVFLRYEREARPSSVPEGP